MGIVFYISSPCPDISFHVQPVDICYIVISNQSFIFLFLYSLQLMFVLQVVP